MSEIWKTLWASARSFSKEAAYPDRTFPFTEDGAQCPLCQQEIDLTTKERLERFDAFVRNDVQTQAATATKTAQVFLDALGKIRPQEAIDERIFSELCDDEDTFGKLIDTFIDGSVQTQKAAIQLGTDCDYPIPTLPVSARTELCDFITNQQQRADVLEKMKPNERIKELQAEAGLLKAKKLLVQKKQVILDDIEKHNKAVRYKECLREVNTTAISRKSSELTEKYVTQSLCKRFETELRTIEHHAIGVKLERSNTGRGTAYHQVKLKCKGNVPVREILSEGEFRCVARAGFLTELATESGKSPIVFDDPVSSLDHCWRDQVAKRLVEESRSRQVIVFTHDLVFFLMVEKHAEKLGITFTSRHVERGSGGLSGVCKEGPPWYAMKVKKRISLLKDLHQKAKAVFNEHGEDMYVPLTTQIYGLLRETWERAVEEVLLAGAVMRFQEEIKTQSLSKVLGDVSDSDYQAIHLGMTRCSKFLSGHDKAPAVNRPTPSLKDVQADIEAIECWVKSVSKRRQ